MKNWKRMSRSRRRKNWQSNALFKVGMGGWGLQLTWKGSSSFEKMRFLVKCVNKGCKIIFLSSKAKCMGKRFFTLDGNKSFCELKICRMVVRIGISWERDENPLRGVHWKTIQALTERNWIKLESLLISKHSFSLSTRMITKRIKIEVYLCRCSRWEANAWTLCKNLFRQKKRNFQIGFNIY